MSEKRSESIRDNDEFEDDSLEDIFNEGIYFDLKRIYPGIDTMRGCYEVLESLFNSVNPVRSFSDEFIKKDKKQDIDRAFYNLKRFKFVYLRLEELFEQNKVKVDDILRKNAKNLMEKALKIAYETLGDSYDNQKESIRHRARLYPRYGNGDSDSINKYLEKAIPISSIFPNEPNPVYE